VRISKEKDFEFHPEHLWHRGKSSRYEIVRKFGLSATRNEKGGIERKNGLMQFSALNVTTAAEGAKKKERITAGSAVWREKCGRK